jgi:hypothetical protein
MLSKRSMIPRRRDAIRAWPTATEAIGGAERRLIPAVILIGVLGLGLWTFAREAPRIAEEL